MKKKITNSQMYILLITICFTIATLWVGLVDLGAFPIEGCVARYFICFAIGCAIIYTAHIKSLKKPNKRILKDVAIMLAVGLASIILTFLLFKIGVFDNLSKRLVVCNFGLLLAIVMLLIYIRGVIPDYFYLTALVFIVGSVFALSYPAGTGISFDDQIHYENILQISHINDDKFSKADKMLIEVAYDDNNIPEMLQSGTTGKFEKKVNEAYEKGGIINHNRVEVRPETTVTYIPEAVMLFLSRGLNLPYTYVFMLGRWVGVLLFTVCLFLSLKRLVSGKLIFFIVSMFPGTLFLMSNYSYDPWGICLSMLAFAYYLGIMQNDTRKMELKDIIIICVLFALAYAAKPNYFCMILAVILISGTKLGRSLSLNKYRIIIIITSLLVAASFVLPYLISGAGGNDMRGGENVNSAEQIMFIINNPVKYARILLDFLKGYWAPSNAAYVSFFAYLGGPKHYSAFLWFAIIIAILDKKKEDVTVTSASRRIWTLLLAFAASCIFATILYIAYTPVASQTIEGCQGRYIIPLLVFVGYYLGDYRIIGGIRKHITDKMLTITTSAVALIYSTYCVYDMVLKLY